MDEQRRDYAVTGAVLLGALGLFGPLTYGIVVAAVASIAAAVGVEGGLTGVAGSVVRIGAVLVALQVVTEVAAIQLHGFGALRRGTRRQRVARHALLGLVVLAAAGLVVGLLVRVVSLGAVTEAPTLATLVGAVAVALAWVAYRSATAFGDGLAAADADAER